MIVNREILSEAYRGAYEVKIIVYNKGSDVSNANIYPFLLKIGYYEVDEKDEKNLDSKISNDKLRESGIVAGERKNATDSFDDFDNKDSELKLLGNSTNATVTIGKTKYVITTNKNELEEKPNDTKRNNTKETKASEKKEKKSSFISYSSFKFLRKYSNITIAPVAGESLEQTI